MCVFQKTKVYPAAPSPALLRVPLLGYFLYKLVMITQKMQSCSRPVLPICWKEKAELAAVGMITAKQPSQKDQKKRVTLAKSSRDIGKLGIHYVLRERKISEVECAVLWFPEKLSLSR